MDLLDNARIKQLLEQAESAVRMLGQVDSHGKRQVKHALTGIYEDLGRHIHGLARQLEARSSQSEKASGEAIRIDELEDLTNEIENTDEVAQGGSPLPHFDAGQALWHSSGQAPTAVPIHEVEATIRQLRDVLDAKSTRDGEPFPWLFDLENLLDMMDASEQLEDANELAIEAVKLQWATSTMSKDWHSYPKPIQIGLVGLLATRALTLGENVPGSLAPSIVIARLRKHVRFSGLPSVHALSQDAQPEEETWSNDATIWWNILVSCVSG